MNHYIYLSYAWKISRYSYLFSLGGPWGFLLIAASTGIRELVACDSEIFVVGMISYG